MLQALRCAARSPTRRLKSRSRSRGWYTLFRCSSSCRVWRAVVMSRSARRRVRSVAVRCQHDERGSQCHAASRVLRCSRRRSRRASRRGTMPSRPHRPCSRAATISRRCSTLQEKSARRSRAPSRLMRRSPTQGQLQLVDAADAGIDAGVAPKKKVERKRKQNVDDEPVAVARPLSARAPDSQAVRCSAGTASRR